MKYPFKFVFSKRIPAFLLYVHKKNKNCPNYSNLKIDGNIKEWERAEIVAFDELKDVGVALPNANDFKGQGRVAWNSTDP